MSLWRQWTRGLRVLTHRQAADADVQDEVQHYFEQAAALHRSEGLSTDQAARAARLEIGSTASVIEQVRDYGWEHTIDTMLADLRYGVRRLRHSPGFTLIAALTLALGVGATTAIFSAVNPILFEPLPYPHAGRIMSIWDKRTDGSRDDVTFGTYREVAERSHNFEALSVYKPWQPTLQSAGPPTRFEGQQVSAGYFQVLGVPPAQGRDFQASDDVLNGPRVAILSDGLWHRAFGGDSAIVGHEVRLDGDGYTVIGVMPKGFESVLASSAELWAPLQYDMSQGRAWGHHLRMIGRVRSGIGTGEATQELNQIAQNPTAEFPRAAWAALTQGFVASPLQDDVTRGVRPALLAVLGAVALLLLIACVNVTNLLLARGAERRSEFAMRAALGADRPRLIRQLLTESLLLAFLGGAGGLLVAQFGVQALLALSPAGLPRASAIRLDTSAFGFALGTTLLIGLLVGIVPALKATRASLSAGIQEGSRRTAGGHQLTRRVLVVAEVALALVLLVASGLLLRSLERLFAIAPGFAPDHVLTVQVQTTGHRYDSDSATYRFFGQALEAVRRVPGVVTAGFTSQLPMSGDVDLYGVHFESSPATNPQGNNGAFRYTVSPGYLETLRIPLHRGRRLDERDVADAPPALLISESFARRAFPGLDPIGQRVHVGPDEGPWYTIVGVVGDVKQVSLALNESDAVYMTPTQWHFADPVMSFVVRSQHDPASLAPAIRQAIWSVDKDQPVVRVATLENLVASSAAERRFSLILFEAFALAALVLAAAGIYGVMSGSVTERTREIGVRSALGATRRSILGLVLGQGLRLAAVGMVIGLVGAVLASRVVVSLLFGVTRLDPVTYGGVMLVLLSVSAMACWLPAWRAARVDPAVTLRAE
jgi:putative ABC transport system permease protein